MVKKGEEEAGEGPSPQEPSPQGPSPQGPALPPALLLRRCLPPSRPRRRHCA